MDNKTTQFSMAAFRKTFTRGDHHIPPGMPCFQHTINNDKTRPRIDDPELFLDEFANKLEASNLSLDDHFRRLVLHCLSPMHRNWFKSVPSEPITWTEFEALFLEHFGQHHFNRREEFLEKLENIKLGKNESIRDFTDRFIFEVQGAPTEIECVLDTYYVRKLPARIREIIQTQRIFNSDERVSDLETLKNIAIRLDNIKPAKLRSSSSCSIHGLGHADAECYTQHPELKTSPPALKQSTTRPQSPSKVRTCHTCGKQGHIAVNCPSSHQVAEAQMKKEAHSSFAGPRALNLRGAQILPLSDDDEEQSPPTTKEEREQALAYLDQLERERMEAGKTWNYGEQARTWGARAVSVVPSSPKPAGIIIPLVIQGFPAQALLDSGAEMSFLSASFMDKHNISSCPVSGFLELANNSRISRKGQSHPLTVITTHGETEITFERMEISNYDAYIGLPDFAKLGIFITGIPDRLPDTFQLESATPIMPEHAAPILPEHVTSAAPILPVMIQSDLSLPHSRSLGIPSSR
eukprot:TRINITY_DN3483_c0_g4_i1.p1 TRINITY_DN3483_c0_g4~~TRINITY_DN3483_c0_g4_i1.p1  ORF type:complete len:521 (-),score=97.20 TRINITY_DN3483_c0_g4_i1:17-1579(-)